MTVAATNTAADHQFQRYWEEAHAFQREWRLRNELNYSYYDGDQYTQQEMKIYEERGQAAIVLNLCRQTIDMIRAMEAQRRVETNVAPRNADDEPMAQVINGSLKQISDLANQPYEESQGFMQALTGGLGVLEVYPYKDDAGEWQVEVCQEPWEQFYWDPFSREPDWSDARFLIKRIWMYIDDAKARWPEKAEEIDNAWNAAVSNQSVAREHFKGQEYKAQNNNGLNAGRSSFDLKNKRMAVHEVYYSRPIGTSRKRRKIHHVIHTDNIFFKGDPDDDEQNEYPYRGANIYPWIPIFALKKRDGTPQGVIDLIRSIQDGVNKLNSKYIHNISTNRILMEEGATDDPEKLRRQAAKPDGVMVVNDGSLQGKRIILDKALEESQHLITKENMLVAHAQRITGVNDATLGIGGTNARTAQQENSRLLQGAALQTSLLESFFLSKRGTAKVVLAMMGEYFTEKRIVRVEGPNGASEFITVNDEAFTDMRSALRYDVVLREVPTFTTVRQAQAQVLSEVMKSNPALAPFMMLSLVDVMELPDKDNIKQQIQQALQQPPGGGAGPAPTAG